VEGLNASEDLVLTVGGSAVVASVTPVTSGTDKGKFYVTGAGITDFTTASTITLELNAAELDADKVKDEAGNLAVFNQAIKIK
ncbi:hypothetical protein SCB29_39640, partial [Paraburkholderia sp. SIMBA_055]